MSNMDIHAIFTLFKMEHTTFVHTHFLCFNQFKGKSSNELENPWSYVFFFFFLISH